MTELRRLFDAQPDEFAIELLRSAEDDSPGARSLAQTAAALGVGALIAGATTIGASSASAAVGAAGAASIGATASPSAAALVASAPTAAGAMVAPAAGISAAATVTFAVLAKQAAIGMAAGMLVMGGVYTTVEAPRREPSSESARVTSVTAAAAARPSRRGETAPSTAPSLSAAELPSAAGDGALPGDVPAPPSGVEVVPRTSIEPHRRASVARKSARTAAAPSVAAPMSSSANPSSAAAAASAVAPAEPTQKAALSLEVELLDRARSALAGGDALAALSVLDQYDRTKKLGVLAPEAQVLRIQVLDRLGRSADASELARDFVMRHPRSRHTGALRPLAERTDASR